MPGRQALSLSEIGDAVSRRFGGEPVVAYSPSLSPNLSSQVLLPSGIAYVNQYTGKVLGERARGQTFLGYVRSLHVRLASGDVGRNILKCSAIAMLFSLASGLYLWWPIKRVRIRGKWGSRRLWFDLHNAIGVFSLLPLVLLAATGTVLGFEDQLAPVIYRLTGSRPIHATGSALREPAEEAATTITPDQAVAIARAHMPGALPYRVQMAKYGGALKRHGRVHLAAYPSSSTRPEPAIQKFRMAGDPLAKLIQFLREAATSRDQATVVVY